MNSNQNVIIDLKNGNKCEGILVNIDKERMVINLSNAKKIITNDDGSKTEENHQKLEISKEDIKEVKIVQFEAKEEPPKKETNINAIPQNLQTNAEIAYNKNRLYNKSDSFFDGLTPMSNLDAKNESIRYNDKNCETFDLPKNQMNDNFSYSSNRRGNNRGSRGNFRGNNSRRGGNYMGNRNNYNNNYNRNHQNFDNSNRSNYSGNTRGSYNNFRGGSRGGYNNNQFYNQGGQRRNFNNNQYDNFNNNYDQGSQFNKQQQMFGGNPNPNFNNDFDNFGNDSQYSGYNNQSNFGGFSQRGGNYQRGGRGQNRNFRGGKNKDNRIPNPEFNALNENNEDQLDDGYVMSIYDKPNSDVNVPQNNQKQIGSLSVYDPNLEKSEVTKSIYDN